MDGVLAGGGGLVRWEDGGVIGIKGDPCVCANGCGFDPLGIGGADGLFGLGEVGLGGAGAADGSAEDDEQEKRLLGHLKSLLRFEHVADAGYEGGGVEFGA